MYYNGKDVEQINRSLITDWGGLNKQISIPENEFSDMVNLSPRRYPLVCPREKRGILKNFDVVSDHSYNNIHQLIIKDKSSEYYINVNNNFDSNVSIGSKSNNKKYWIETETFGDEKRIKDIKIKNTTYSKEFVKLKKNKDYTTELAPAIMTAAGTIVADKTSVNFRPGEAFAINTYSGYVHIAYSYTELENIKNEISANTSSAYKQNGHIILHFNRNFGKVVGAYHRKHDEKEFIALVGWTDITYSATFFIASDGKKYPVYCRPEKVFSIRTKAGNIVSSGDDNTYTGKIGIVYMDSWDLSSVDTNLTFETFFDKFKDFIDVSQSLIYKELSKYISDKRGSCVLFVTGSDAKASVKFAYRRKYGYDEWEYFDNFQERSHTIISYFYPGEEIGAKIKIDENKIINVSTNKNNFVDENGNRISNTDVFVAYHPMIIPIIIGTNIGQISDSSAGIPKSSDFKRSAYVLCVGDILSKKNKVLYFDYSTKSYTELTQHYELYLSGNTRFFYESRKTPIGDENVSLKLIIRKVCREFDKDYDNITDRQIVKNFVELRYAWFRTTTDSSWSKLRALYDYSLRTEHIEYISVLYNDDYTIEYTYNDDTPKTTKNYPTGFCCRGAWIYSSIRYDGTHRLFFNNYDLQKKFTGNTISDISMKEENRKFNLDEYVAEQKDIRRSIVSMGAKTVVFPEKYYVNLFDKKDKGSLECKRYPLWQDGFCDSDMITISPCTSEGEVYGADVMSSTAPIKPYNGQVWLDTSKDITAYKVYDAGSKSWNEMATTFVRIDCKGAFKGFKRWDGIKISGLDKYSLVQINEEALKDDYKNLLELSSVGRLDESQPFNITNLIMGAMNLTLDGVSDVFDDGDYISTWEGLVDKYLKTAKLKQIGKQLKTLNQNTILYRCTDDYIVIVGLIDAVCGLSSFSLSDNTDKSNVITKQYGKFSFERLVPEMDYYCEVNNRIWGCKFGWDEEKKEQANNIYACKQGDPTNWNSFFGVATDSYTVTVGSDGEFTGCVNYNGFPTFFKQKEIIMIYGNFPSNYQLVKRDVRGVGKGLGGSICVCAGGCYYATPSEFVVFNGSTVSTISRKLGKLDIVDCISGTDGQKIYWCVTDSQSKKTLYVYDTSTGFFYIEDCGDLLFFASDANVIYAIERWHAVEGGIDRYRIITMSESVNTVYKGKEFEDKEWPEWDDEVEWSCTTGDIGYSSPYGKYVQKISIRADVPKNAHYNLYISYDGGSFEKLTPTNESSGIKARDYTFIIKRCDRFKLKLVGKGDVTLISLYKIFTNGSDKN